MKRSFFLFAALLFLTLSIPVRAASMAYDANPSLSFSGTAAYCSVVCQGSKSTDSISATLTLYRGSAEIDSWSNSGTFCVPVCGNCGAASGVTYRLELTWTVNGVAQPAVSVTNTCP